MLNIVQAVLPRGQLEWDDVTNKFNQVHGTDWDRDRIKTKFQNLVKIKKPTGDPTCPPEVRQAKHIRAAIEALLCVLDPRIRPRAGTRRTRHPTWSGPLSRPFAPHSHSPAR